MDQVLQKVKANGIAFSLGQEEEFRLLYEPFYRASDPRVVTLVSDCSYGEHERNKLDVYFPTKQSDEPRPVLIYSHGGGFFSGDKAWSRNVYGNIGNYFAERGVIVVVANHHLIPDAIYPQGSEDIQLTREWVYNNIEKEEYGNGDRTKVILFGHSSGGAHVASNLFSAGDPSMPARDPLFPPVAGLALFSVPWWFDMRKPMRNKMISTYFGSGEEEVWEPRSPLGLFKRIPDDSPLLDSDKLPILLGTVKWETVEATDGALMFFNSYRARSSPAGSLPIYQVLDRHNHLSNVLSIGTEDDEQARNLLHFIESCTKNK